jgi:hypothetical protein
MPANRINAASCERCRRRRSGSRSGGALQALDDLGEPFARLCAVVGGEDGAVLLIDQTRSGVCAGICTIFSVISGSRLGCLDRAVWLDRLARERQSPRVRIAREQIRDTEAQTRRIRSLVAQLDALVGEHVPQLLEEVGCGRLRPRS